MNIKKHMQIIKMSLVNKENQEGLQMYHILQKQLFLIQGEDCRRLPQMKKLKNQSTFMMILIKAEKKLAVKSANRMKYPSLKLLLVFIVETMFLKDFSLILKFFVIKVIKWIPVMTMKCMTCLSKTI